MTFPSTINPWRHTGPSAAHKLDVLDISPKATIERIRSIALAERRGLLSFARPDAENIGTGTAATPSAEAGEG
ncbi:hypothetical protein JIN84_05185 [Luteolibacter yonseiensis]|uniref:Uncharacterized protein n=1 Tax=Luteolibacter yonseiensis TaxID=1144680 RepID=A0A934R212_9BACT|nr:hypothetical protein [Luteolibacter yonseiensis]MBK1814997.1 hypothetical protein [Luteolibacter yonseiensis]